MSTILNRKIEEALETKYGITIVSLLQNGNFSDVFHVRKEGSYRYDLKAIKLMIRNSETELMLKAEKNAVKALNYRGSWNVCVPELYGEVPGAAFILMPMYEKDLLEYISENNLDVTEQDRMVFGTLRGLVFIHSRNLIHGDIKLENIMIGMYRAPKIGDFGLSAQVRDGSEVVEDRRGTPGYMAPETHRKGILCQTSDVFSLGVTLYRVIRMEVYFENTTTETLNDLSAWENAYQKVESIQTEMFKKVLLEMLEFDYRHRITSQNAFNLFNEERDKTFVPAPPLFDVPKNAKLGSKKIMPAVLESVTKKKYKKESLVIEKITGEAIQIMLVKMGELTDQKKVVELILNKFNKFHVEITKTKGQTLFKVVKTTNKTRTWYKVTLHIKTKPSVKEFFQEICNVYVKLARNVITEGGYNLDYEMKKFLEKYN